MPAASFLRAASASAVTAAFASSVSPAHGEVGCDSGGAAFFSTSARTAYFSSRS